MDIDIMKLFWLLLKPGNALLLIVALSSIYGFYAKVKWVERVRSVSLILLIGIGLTPIAYWLAAPLEHRHPNTALPSHVAGLVVLGGYEQSSLSKSYDTPQTNEAAERLLAGAILAHRFPTRPIILTGGGRGAEPEALTGRRFLRETGIEATRIRLETQSRNTYENATLAHPLAQEDGVWILITSAVHMPRAMNTFQAKGWDVQPYSTDYITDQEGGLANYKWDMAENISLFNHVSKEWIGLLVYKLKGYFNTDHS